MKVSSPKTADRSFMKQLDAHFENAVILDVETTGLAAGNEDLERNKEITNISIIDAQTGKNIFTTFVKPKHHISNQLAVVNVINDDIVRNAPSFKEIYPEVIKATQGKKIIGWNIQFDINTLIEEAKKLGRDYLSDSQITGFEDGMELAMKASGLFPHTYNTAMFWKQDEACRLFGSYIANAQEIEEMSPNKGKIDHQKELNDYIDNSFDEKYRKQLHEQLGNKEMHLALCDNKEYRLTMIKATEMYRNGITADRDKFIDSLFTQKKKNRYLSMLEKEDLASEIIGRVLKGENISDLRDHYQNAAGGRRAFDNIILKNKKDFENSRYNPFGISGYPKKLINELYSQGNNVFDISQKTGYDILTVRSSISKSIAASAGKTGQLKEELSKNNKPVSSEIMENLSKKEAETIEKYSALKTEQKRLQTEIDIGSACISAKLQEENPSEKKIYMNSFLKITFDPQEKVKSSFNANVFSSECPDLYDKFIVTLPIPQKRESIRFTPSSSGQTEEIEYEFTEDLPLKLHNAIVNKKAIEAQAKEMEHDVMEILKRHDCSRIDSSLGHITYSLSVTQEKLDTKALKLQYPEIYEYYTDKKIEKNRISLLADPKKRDRAALSMDELFQSSPSLINERV